MARIPNHLRLALVSLVVAVVALLLTGTVLAATGGRFWGSFGASACALIAVTRALRARSEQAPLDVRHRLGEGARSLAVLSLLYSVGILALNGVLLLVR